MKYDWDTWDEKMDSVLEKFDQLLADEFHVEGHKILFALAKKDIYNQIRSAMSGFISYEEDEGEEV